MNKIDKLKIFLQENYPNEQAFNTRNIVGDSMETVYNEDGIMVDYCYNYGYIEIFISIRILMYFMLPTDISTYLLIFS